MDKNSSSPVRNVFGRINRELILTILTLISIILAIVCICICNACLDSVSKANEGIEKVVKEVQSVKSANTEISERISHLETVIGNTQNALNESAASRYIRITKQPSSVSTYVGRTDAMLFSVVAEGTGLRFTWQKLDRDNTWKEVVFDGNGFNSDLGIRLYNDTANGKSELWTKDFKPASFGAYRCLISDAQGTQVYSESIQVQEKAAP